jgi:dipeptidase E
MDNGLTGRRLLLIDNPKVFGKDYLAHYGRAILELLGPINRLVVIPYAQKDCDAYTELAREAFAKMGISATGIHQGERRAHLLVLKDAAAVFVGGGSTHRLLKILYDQNLRYELEESVGSGRVAYIGEGAGAYVACPTIRTCGEWNIVGCAKLEALNIFPWQIVKLGETAAGPAGDSLQKRIAEFHEENDLPVVGLREGSRILVNKNEAKLQGKFGAIIYRAGMDPAEWRFGEPLFLS